MAHGHAQVGGPSAEGGGGKATCNNLSLCYDVRRNFSPISKGSTFAERRRACSVLLVPSYAAGSLRLLVWNLSVSQPMATPLGVAVAVTGWTIEGGGR